MNCPSRSSLILAAIASGCLAGNAIAEKALSANGKLTYYGDLRLRYEADYDSARADGTMRDDRHRARIRARVGSAAMTMRRQGSSPTGRATAGLRQ